MVGRNFYISDYHFFHELSLRRSRNEFQSVEEMNETIVARHNQKVTNEDHVYILGDVVVCEEKDLESSLSQTIDRMKGHLHLILGNHDMKFRENPIFLKRFETVDDALWLKDGKKNLQLFHYPILMWYRKTKGAYHLYGHLHNEIKGEEVRWLMKESAALNACVEINHFEPCTLEELIANNRAFKQTYVQ